MWARRVDLNLAEPMTAGFRYGNGREVFKSRMRCPPEAAEGMQQIAMDGLRWFEEEFARLAALDGREFLGGAAVGLADILMYCCERTLRPRLDLCRFSDSSPRCLCAQTCCGETMNGSATLWTGRRTRRWERGTTAWAAATAPPPACANP